MHTTASFRGLILAASAALILWAPPVLSGPATPAFTHGVASGEITADGAVLWTRVEGAPSVKLEVSADPSFRQDVHRRTSHASAEADFTVRSEIQGLDPATLYYYRFRAGTAVSEAGTFRTAPRPFRPASVRFGWSSDFDGSPDPPINQFETLDRAREDGLDFFIYNGDNIYADNAPACGADITCIRGRYKHNREYAALRNLLASTGSYVLWDDHEVVDDFAIEDVDPAMLVAGMQAFQEYMPIADARPGVGFFRTVRWGKDLELFILDERSFRSSEAGPACQGDLLPTSPPDVRILAGLLPEPPAGCVEAIFDPSRTMLGERQKSLLRLHLLLSQATWKVIVNAVPMAELFGVPYDRWEGYADERREVLQFIRDWNIKNVVFLTGDLHANMIVDVRPNTFLDPTPVAKELIAGPVAEHTLFEELVGLLGSEEGANGFIGLVTSLSAPDCFEPNAYAYGVVDIDSATRRLTVTFKNSAGAAICSHVLEAEP